MYLKNEDGFNISKETLYRHLKLLRFFRWKAQSDMLDVALLLQDVS